MDFLLEIRLGPHVCKASSLLTGRVSLLLPNVWFLSCSKTNLVSNSLLKVCGAERAPVLPSGFSLTVIRKETWEITSVFCADVRGLDYSKEQTARRLSLRACGGGLLSVSCQVSPISLTAGWVLTETHPGTPERLWGN